MANSPSLYSSVYPSGSVYSNVTPPQFESNLLTILKLPLYRKCSSLNSFIEEALNTNSKEIHQCFIVITENIFAFGSQACESNWNLKTLSRINDAVNFDAVFAFLSPDGVLFNLIKHLMFDPVFKCYFPISCLPASTKAMIEKGIIPEFYLNRISVDSSTGNCTQVALSAIEFYLFHFFHFICNDNWNTQTSIDFLQGNNSSSLIYVALLESYLKYFLPLSTNEGNANTSLSNSIANGNHSLWKSLSSTTSNLLHLGTSTQDSGMVTNVLPKSKLLNLTPLLNGASRVETSFRTPHVIESFGSATWKAETFINIFTEMLLTVGSMTLTSKKQNESILSPMFVSNSEQMRCVRIFVKHLHYFANSVSNQGSPFFNALELCEIDVVKRSILTNRNRVQRRLYSFLRVCFEHWPLDASFRLPLETWLSYIQPWRYVDLNDHKKSFSELDDKSSLNEIDYAAKWKHFICDNLLFYTVLFQEVVSRSIRLDLTSSKNSLMLFRLIKVFCQPNLIQILKEVEGSLETMCTPLSSVCSPSRGLLLSPSLRNSSSPANHSLSYRHHLAIDCEQPEFVYSPISSENTQATLKKLLIEVGKAKREVSENMKYYLNKQSNTCSVGLVNFVKSLFADDTEMSEEKRILSELQKTESHLSMVNTKLCQTFEFDIPQIEFSKEKSSGFHSSFQKLSAFEKHQKADTVFDVFGTPKLSESGRYQVLNRLREPEVRYQGNPDTQPVRSFEVAFLVSLFAMLSNVINQKYCNKFAMLYNRQDLIGYIVRYMLSPPTTYTKLEKRGVSQPPNRILETLPPRVNLRILANKKILLYLLISLIFVYMIGFGGLSSIAVLLIFIIIASLNRHH